MLSGIARSSALWKSRQDGSSATIERRSHTGQVSAPSLPFTSTRHQPQPSPTPEEWRWAVDSRHATPAYQISHTKVRRPPSFLVEFVAKEHPVRSGQDGDAEAVLHAGISWALTYTLAVGIFTIRFRPLMAVGSLPTDVLMLWSSTVTSPTQSSCLRMAAMASLHLRARHTHFLGA